MPAATLERRTALQGIGHWMIVSQFEWWPRCRRLRVMERQDVSWARATLWGIAAMAGAGAFGIVLRWLGYLNLADVRQMSGSDIFALTVFVVAIIPAVVVPIVTLDRIWVVIIALCVLPTVPFGLAVLTTVQPFGPIPAMALEQARPPGGLDTGIRITDAAPRRDLARSVAFSITGPTGRRGGRTTTTIYRYQVAPVVHAQWVPGMPIAVWAVVEGTAHDPHWDAGAGALFRPIDLSMAERAVRRFRADRTVPGPAQPEMAAPVIGLWVADAGATRLAQVADWALLLGGASLAWALLAWLGLQRKPAAGAAQGTGPRMASAKLPPRWKRRPR